MKINMPVTQVEREMLDGTTLVTKTDLRGVITYLNREFIEISGFSEDELMGASHNVVRHPDMPPQAFEDLWTTIKSGLPWTGLVKNRCKNGDFYWVVANVTPIREGGQVIGYMSVRTKPTRMQIEEATALYRQIRDKKLRFPPTPSPLQRLANLSLGTKIHGFVAFLLAALVIGAAGGLLINDYLLGRLAEAMAGVSGSGAEALQQVHADGLAVAGQIRYVVIGGALFVILVAAWFSRFLVRSMTNPIRQALDTFNQIGEGRYDTPIDISGRDEIGLVMN